MISSERSVPVRANAPLALAREPLLARTTRQMLRFRGLVLAFWIAVLIAGGAASTRLNALLSDGFAVPGTESYQAQLSLQRHFGDRGDGEILVLFHVGDARDRSFQVPLQATIDHAVQTIPSAQARWLQLAGKHIVYAHVVSQLNLAQANHNTGRLLSALGRPQGAHPYVTGQAAIQHDLGPIFNQDLR